MVILGDLGSIIVELIKAIQVLQHSADAVLGVRSGCLRKSAHLQRSSSIFTMQGWLGPRRPLSNCELETVDMLVFLLMMMPMMTMNEHDGNDDDDNSLATPQKAQSLEVLPPFYSRTRLPETYLYFWQGHDLYCTQGLRASAGPHETACSAAWGSGLSARSAANVGQEPKKRIR